MKIGISIIALVSILFVSCSTEVELNAPYKPTSIVYGLLDPKADTQWVKINKTFLGDGNNLDYATMRDSSEYAFEDFVAVVRELSGSNEVTSWTLDSMTINDKDLNGIFYAPRQSAYFFTTPGGLNQDHKYIIDVDFSIKDDVRGTTWLVNADAIQVQSPQPNSESTIKLADPSGSSFQYKTSQIIWLPTASAPFYELSMRFHYKEKKWADVAQTILESESMKYLDYFVGNFDETQITQSGKIIAEVNGESFFAFLGNNLEANSLITREIGFYDQVEGKTKCFDVRIAFGGDELYTYVQVFTPVTGIVQERPGYTNIEGGLGLFSSRSQINITDINLIGVNNQGIPQTGNLLAFMLSEYTQDLNFCDPNPSSDYSCD